jgi:hypothetical protein
MRRVLIIVTVAVALFAVGAFAASITTTNSEDVASGSDAVTACADEVDIDFATTWDATENDWDITGATLTFFNSDSPTTACSGFDAEIRAEGAANTNLFSGTGTVSGSTATLTLSNNETNVATVVQASVLVGGEELQGTL